MGRNLEIVFIITNRFSLEGRKKDPYPKALILLLSKRKDRIEKSWIYILVENFLQFWMASKWRRMRTQEDSRFTRDDVKGVESGERKTEERREK